MSFSIPSVEESLFGKDYKLLPSVSELFELELANLEYKKLKKKDFLERTAFCESLNGNYSKHYLMYSSPNEILYENRSAATQNYFENGQFSAGYATHSLFPYRGKFHPQLIKAILNIIGVKKGDTVLDPMCGSGTTNIEAALLGIDSVACDVSPFCRLMTEVKFESLRIKPKELDGFNINHANLFNLFSDPEKKFKVKEMYSPNEFRVINLARLAFLDSMGYATRVTRSSHQQLFVKVLNRYFQTVKSVINNPHFDMKELGKVSVHQTADALNLKIQNRTIDAIVTSPPYSFAIDYVANDKDQLEYLGFDTKDLKDKMIGLRGKNKDERLTNYFQDMGKHIEQVAKILKKNKFYVLVIGSNTNQTGGVRLENEIIKSAHKNNLPLSFTLVKPIKGIRNTMKDELILFFQKQ